MAPVTRMRAFGKEIHTKPSGEPRCRRRGGNGWQCNAMASSGLLYCHKHYKEREAHKEKRRKGPTQSKCNSVEGVKQVNPAAVGSREQRGRKRIMESETNSDEVVHGLGVKKCRGPSVNDEEEETEATEAEITTIERGVASDPNIVITFAESPLKCKTSIRNSTEDGQNDTVMQTFGSDHNNDEENEDLPFVKTYPVWKTLECMEVFQSMTRYPHFRPLEQESECLREGKAVAYMLSFASIFAESQKIQLDKPKSFFEDRLNGLLELEANGFHVQSLRNKLYKLLQGRDRQAWLDGKLKQVEGKILEGKHEEELLKFEVDNVNENIRDLKASMKNMIQKQENITGIKQIKDFKVSALQGIIHETEEKILSTNIEFTAIAAAPW